MEHPTTNHTYSPPLDSIFLLLPILLVPTIFLLHRIHKDYQAFLALGPGGTPSTPTGYLRICLLRLFTIRDPFQPPSLPPTLLPKTGLLNSNNLPQRHGPRPTVAGIAPQRQMTQKANPAMYETLSTEIQKLVSQNPEALYEGTSCFEKHSTGMFCSSTDTPQQQSAGTLKDRDISSLMMSRNQQWRHRRTCNGEVCHAHPSDGSLHLTLHPADVKAVIERGWGQRHPLTRESWWWCYLRTVPTGFVMIYAPRDQKELECVLKIIRAAAWWVSGEELVQQKTQKWEGAPLRRQIVEGLYQFTYI
ncbi:uncharacterized protein BO87DRAFT_381870 [Aspergillus neoniger CBS 115656]|uniref:Luciferase domain-containing protein n=1 Tax=Aspergillus neoniger (strain CBS 115656) TaxID=1448310 RepID=A0A318YYU9_ASPNB|nr:hypothetical protein BO87DRAFT_381870 [Aspergillus neoniger CBS 115656]PYH39846.1 hypothetical protein BO87DRAFT_381870 [Aspergillus neoniger CBS 115656]